jgi:diguanylate cyclase (GGDEF)-like protein
MLSSIRSLFSSTATKPETSEPQIVNQVRRQVEGIRRTVLYDGEVGLYQRWYLELRLNEEMQRCDRYGLSFALICVRLLNLQHHDAAEDSWQRRASGVAYVTAKAVRTVDLTATVGTGEFAICLVHCDRSGAEKAVRRLREALGEYPCEIGVAAYPEDHLEGRLLIELARGRARPIGDGLA